jgi:hypothetical protein
VDRAQGCWDSKRRLDALGTVAPVIVSIILPAYSERLLGRGQQAPQVIMAQVSTWMERCHQPSPSSTPTGALSVQQFRRTGNPSLFCDQKPGFSARLRWCSAAEEGWSKGRICLENMQPRRVSTRLLWVSSPFHRIRKTVLNWAEGHPDEGGWAADWG